MSYYGTVLADNLSAIYHFSNEPIKSVGTYYESNIIILVLHYWEEKMKEKCMA